MSFGEVIYDVGGSYGPSAKGYFQMLGVIEGEAEVETKGRKVHIGAGHVGLLLPTTWEMQRFSPTHKTHHFWCSIHSSQVPENLIQACRSAPNVLPITRRLEQVMELGLSLPVKEGRRGENLLEHLGMVMLDEYLFDSEREQSHVHDLPDTLRRALHWIELQGSQPTDLAQLAREAGLSPWGLLKLFRRHLDTTPMRYLWKMRTRFGAQLLRETSLSAAEVADRSGFQSAEHFAHLLRQYFGMSPRQFRACVWGKESSLPPEIATLPWRNLAQHHEFAADFKALPPPPGESTTSITASVPRFSSSGR